MLWKFLLVGLVCFLLGAAAAMFFGPVLSCCSREDLPSCPYLGTKELSVLPAEVISAAGAYEAIRETLQRGSTEGVSAQAAAIARAFENTDPEISACAKRLGDGQDVESARRAFMRMHRLMQQHARRMPQA